LPPESTVFAYMELGRQVECIHHELYVKCREQAERDARPTAAFIDN
jgi:hypothetical protein